jgi:hypothetical protein
MINNFEQIKSLLRFESPEDFYFIQIISRKKDNKTLHKNHKVLADFFVYSLKDLDGYESKIIDICNHGNARAYIRLNRRNSKRIALVVLKKVTDCIIAEEYKSMKTIYSSAVGETNCETDKTWLIDIDFKDFNDLSLLETVREELEQLQVAAKRIPMLETVTTKNGFHFITRPFNLSIFREKFPQIDVHKDNPTVLYIA